MSDKPLALKLADSLDAGTHLLSRDRNATSAELRRMHAENEHWRTTASERVSTALYDAHTAELKAEVLHLHAEVETLRADAERYRWLRGELEGPHVPLAQVVWKLHSIRDSDNWTNLCDGYSLDEHIDAARSGKDSLTVDAIDAARGDKE